MTRRSVAVLLLAFLAWVAADEADWMLSEDEILNSREGWPRSDLSTLSHGNKIIPLIDTSSFFKSLCTSIEATVQDDYIHATMFTQSLQISLFPNASNPAQTERTRVGNLLVAALKRGVNVRVLANINVYEPFGAAEFCKPLNEYCFPKGEQCCAPEFRHGTSSGAIHAKLWLVQRQGELVGYFGSDDVAPGRYDTQLHNFDAQRKLEPPEANPYWGWHGNQFEVHGPVVRDFARHFWQLWNDPVPPSTGYKLTPFPWISPPIPTNPPDPENYTLSMQFIRTLSCFGAKNYHYYQTFAPKGEYSFAAAYYKSMRNAKRYIFMQDQYTYFDEAMKAVADALPHVEAVIIVTDTALSYLMRPLPDLNITIAQDMRYYYQYESMAPLLADPELAKKVHCFQLLKRGEPLHMETIVYDHSKNYFVDDEFLITGSTGIERTAFTNDVDMAAGIYDPSIDRATPTHQIHDRRRWLRNEPRQLTQEEIRARADSFAGRHRRALWAEMLGMSPDDERLIDPVKAVAEWERVAAEGKQLIRPYWPKKVDLHWYIKDLYDIYEPDGRCKSTEEDAQQQKREQQLMQEYQNKHKHQ